MHFTAKKPKPIWVCSGGQKPPKQKFGLRTLQQKLFGLP